jgi:SAM-dependent methyltransferase
MTRKSFHLEIFLASFAALLLEVSYTRVFSFKVSSYYTYLIIGLALLGIGGGGVFVALVRRLREIPTARLLLGLGLAGGAAIGIGYFAVAAVELSTHEPPSSPAQVARLAWVCGVLFSNFLAIGLIIAVIFTRRPEAIHRLYFADLAGAAAGCAAAIPAMLLLSPPGCVFASGAVLALAGLRHGIAAERRLAGVAAVLSLGLLLGAAFPGALPDPVPDPVKTMAPRKMARWGFTSVFRKWHPLFRVDVLESKLIPGRKALIHDGDWGSALYAFDGDLAALGERYDASSRHLPFAVARERPRVLIVGSAGGNEILASLYFGAARVTAVELNPVTVSLLRDRFAGYTGHLAERERVTLVNAEGRSFLSRDDSEYDLIYFVAPDSYATMNAAQASGFVLVESYLYTTEMVAEAVRHLAPGGILCMQFGEVDYLTKPNRTARYLATARKAFGEMGIDDFARHVLVATNVDFPIELATILLRTTPFTKDQVDAFLRVADAIPKGGVRHAWGHEGDHRAPNAVITVPPDGLERLYRRYAYNIRPVSDDSPFFWHFARFRDVVFGGNPALRKKLGPEDGKGEQALVVMLAVATAFSAAFLLLPFLTVRDRWSRLPAKARGVVYFAALGLGFMFFEIALLQKLTLFLGYPTYSLTVTLFALLVFSGLGSAATAWYGEARNRALPVLVGILLALTVFYAVGLERVVAAWIGQPLGLRIALAVGVLAPLGLALGAFMPLGLRTVARSTEYTTEYVAWGWAVNGVFSVMGSILATILSMTFGLRDLLWLAALAYVAAGTVLWTIPLGPRLRA